jgi:peptide/nickel transport system substrate-binding protein
MLQTGEKDAIIAIPPEQFQRAQGLSGVKVVTQAGSNDTYFAFPLKDHPDLAQGPTRELFKDVRVRQAFNYAVDKDGLAEKVFAGLGTAFSVTVDTQPWHIGKKYEYNPQRARELLSAAGATGMKLNQYMLAGSRLPGLGPLGAAVASNLRDVGVDVTELNEEFENWLNRLYTNRTPYPDEGMVFSWAGSANGLNPVLLEGKWLGASTTSWYDNPQVNTLLAEMRTTPDQEGRFAKIREACDILYEDAAGLWMVLINDAIGIRSSVVADWRHAASYNVLRIQDLYAA